MVNMYLPLKTVTGALAQCTRIGTVRWALDPDAEAFDLLTSALCTDFLVEPLIVSSDQPPPSEQWTMLHRKLDSYMLALAAVGPSGWRTFGTGPTWLIPLGLRTGAQRQYAAAKGSTGLP
jgi:hypothetical protein